MAKKLAPEVLAHLEWLGFVQPTGLVVSPMALSRLGVSVQRNDKASQARLLELIPEETLPPDAEPAPQFERGATAPESAAVWLDGARRETRLIDRAGLAPGDRVDGPAVVTQLDSTTLVAPGWRAAVDDHGNLLLERA